MIYRASKFFIKIPLKKGVLLINGLTGSVDLVSSRYSRQISQFKPQQIVNHNLVDQRLFRYLVKQKYLISTREEEINKYKHLVSTLQKTNKNSQTIYICINPTERCNLSCFYCINSPNRQNVLKFPPISPDKIRSIFQLIDRFIKDGKTIGGNQIKLFGGEPLLPGVRPTITAICHECQLRNFSLDITTNGTYVRNYLNLIDKYPNVFKHFQITLDGPVKVHNQRRSTSTGKGYFNEIIIGVDSLLKRNKWVTLRSNFDKNTLKYLPEVGKLIKQKKWYKHNMFLYAPHNINSNYVGDSDCFSNRAIFLKTVHQIIKSHSTDLSFIKPIDLIAEPEELIIKAVFPKQKLLTPFFPSVHGCAANGLHSLTFASDNKIYTCNASVGIDEFCVGEYYPKYRIYPSKKRFWETNRFVNTLSDCKDCRFQFMCGGGCALSTYFSSHNIKGVENEWCENIQDDLETVGQIFEEKLFN